MRHFLGDSLDPLTDSRNEDNIVNIAKDNKHTNG